MMQYQNLFGGQSGGVGSMNPFSSMNAFSGLGSLFGGQQYGMDNMFGSSFGANRGYGQNYGQDYGQNYGQDYSQDYGQNRNGFGPNNGVQSNSSRGSNQLDLAGIMQKISSMLASLQIGKSGNSGQNRNNASSCRGPDQDTYNKKSNQKSQNSSDVEWNWGNNYASSDDDEETPAVKVAPLTTYKGRAPSVDEAITYMAGPDCTLFSKVEEPKKGLNEADLRAIANNTDKGVDYSSADRDCAAALLSHRDFFNDLCSSSGTGTNDTIISKDDVNAYYTLKTVYKVPDSVHTRAARMAAAADTQTFNSASQQLYDSGCLAANFSDGTASGWGVTSSQLAAIGSGRGGFGNKSTKINQAYTINDMVSALVVNKSENKTVLKTLANDQVNTNPLITKEEWTNFVEQNS